MVVIVVVLLSPVTITCKVAEGEEEDDCKRRIAIAGLAIGERAVRVFDATVALQ